MVFFRICCGNSTKRICNLIESYSAHGGSCCGLGSYETPKALQDTAVERSKDFIKLASKKKMAEIEVFWGFGRLVINCAMGSIHMSDIRAIIREYNYTNKVSTSCT